MSATELHTDLIRGSSLTIGQQDYLHDTAVRVHYIKDVPADYAAGLKEAIEAATADDLDTGATEPLKAMRATARKHTSSTAYVTVQYGRRAWGSPGATPEAYLAASFDTFVAYVQWYSLPTSFDSAGRPNGPLNTLVAPSPFVYPVPGLIIFTPTTLATHPMPAVADLLHKINSDNVVGWGGYTFAPYTVRFMGMAVRWFRQGNNDEFYRTEYEHQVLKWGWVQQEVEFVSGAWQLRTQDGNDFIRSYASAAFSGQFPVAN